MQPVRDLIWRGDSRCPASHQGPFGRGPNAQAALSSLGAYIMVSRNLFAGAFASVLVFVCAAAIYPANALTFQFSFNNSPGNDPSQSLVQGIISGLQDNLADQPATSVQVTSNPAGFGLGEYVPTLDLNFFAVSGGILTLAEFQSFGGGLGGCCTLGLIGPAFGLRNSPDSNFFLGSANLTFTAVAETPLPAALPLFAGGLGLIGLLAHRKRRKTFPV